MLQLDPRQLLEDADDGAPLPDGIFLIETLPSEIARRLVSERGYRLVGLPFAEAFALSAFPEELAARAGFPAVVERRAADLGLPHPRERRPRLHRA